MRACRGTTQVIVVNDGSSPGKSGITRCLQGMLSDPWLRIGVGDLIDAPPPSLPIRGGTSSSAAHSQAHAEGPHLYVLAGRTMLRSREWYGFTAWTVLADGVRYCQSGPARSIEHRASRRPAFRWDRR